MRLLFYLFIISQLLNILGVFADKEKKESLVSDSINWVRIKENESNKLKSIDKVIWKSYEGSKNYFQNKNEEIFPTINKKKISKEKIYQSKKELLRNTTEVEPYLPLNNFLDYGKF